jgi:hypothetical protein
METQLEFTKKLFPSNLQLAGMHDQYITVPTKAVPQDFFGTPPLEIKFIDKVSGSYFLFPFKKEKNDEYRLSKFKAYFELKKAQVGDSIQVKKKTKNKIIIYEIDLIKNKENIITKNEDLYPDELTSADENTLPEGAKVRITVNKYERSKKAREECIEHWKALCAVCELEFINRYGEIGDGFIHVHHKTPISNIGKKYEINPINDLIPVCPNCHAMIHKKNPPFTIEEVKKMLV